jgi:A/G-specific adenine glycosylase
VSSLLIPSAAALLRWYDRHRRVLPWRAGPGAPPDAYRVWLSEIMLQQTTVAAVIPYYERFVSRFPTVESLAAAPAERVMAAWAGLGYYARARNLHACARILAAAGRFPDTLEGLRALPGIGEYTAAAVGAIAFGLPVVPVDGNVERVVARLFAIDVPLPAGKAPMRAAAARLMEDAAARERPSDFAQALFDLGAGTCSVASPDCMLCPWSDACIARAQGIAADLPRRAPKPTRPVRYGVLFWLTDEAGRVLLRRRPESGLLGGTTELPGTVWRTDPWSEAEAVAAAPMPADWRSAGEVRHGLTHFELRIAVFTARVARIEAAGFLCPVADLHDQALASVMRKCVRMAGTAGCG